MMDLLEKKKLEGPGERQPQFRLGVPTLNAREIMGTEFPEPAWVVPGLIPGGVTILASSPKMGKSWLCLGLGLGVASGETVLGQISVTPREVLYIAMEDTNRRLQRRLEIILQGRPAPGQMHFSVMWPRFDATGLQELHNWMKGHPETGLILIDTLARVRGPRRGFMYDSDYEAIAQLKTIADDYGLGIVVVHHLRKAEAADVMDMISGSSGLTGAADNVAVLKRERSRSEATLFVSGREVEEQELALKFEAERGSWAIMGSAEECRLTQERQEIVDLIRKEGCIMKLGDIARALGKKVPNVHHLLTSLVDQGIVEKIGYGKYKLKVATGEPTPEASGKEEARLADGPVAGASIDKTGKSTESAPIE
jgi:hypothetical protein